MLRRCINISDGRILLPIGQSYDDHIQPFFLRPVLFIILDRFAYV